jgi:hypothetical protein
MFIAAWAIFEQSGGSRHYLLQGSKFSPMVSTYGLEQRWLFYVLHLLQHGTSVYTNPKDWHPRPAVEFESTAAVSTAPRRRLDTDEKLTMYEILHNKSK